MSSREQGQQLLETIDAVLAECGKDPRRRRPARPPARPTWTGPGRWQAEGAKDRDPASRRIATPGEHQVLPTSGGRTEAVG